jgi:hypothetical protein
MHRRTLVKAAAGFVTLAGFAPAAAASQASAVTVAGNSAPGAILAAQDATELDITVTPEAIEGIPATLAAGRYALNVAASADLEFGGGVEFVQPGGMSAADFMALASPSSAPAGDASASPAAEGGEERGAPPAVLWESVYAGGVYAQAGATARGIVDLGPGEWVVFGGFDNPQQPFTIEVTGELPAGLAAPESTATITMGEYTIEVTEGELVAGPQTVRIDNIGAQPHFIVASFTEKTVTDDDVAAVLEAEMTGTPAAVDFDPDADLEDAFYTANQSTDTTMWLEVDLRPGSYVLLCFFPDQADGMPHAMHGMFKVVTIDN